MIITRKTEIPDPLFELLITYMSERWMTKCARCNGSGRMQVRSVRAQLISEKDPRELYSYIHCAFCNGTSTVWKNGLPCYG